MKKISVAVILHGLARNGIDMLMATLAKYWDYSRFDVTYLLAVDPEDHQPLEDDVAAAGARVIRLHDLDRGRWIRWPATIRRALKEYGPFDAVHYHMYFLNGINARAADKAGIPVRICHAHNASGPHAGRIGRECYQTIMRRLIIRHSTMLLSCSEKAGRYFYKDQAFHVIPNGIETERFRPGNEADRPRGLRFITVGRLEMQKNPLFLLEVFSRLHLLLPGATLDWIGTGQMEDQIRQRISGLGLTDAVRLLGSRPDVNEFLKQSDYFLFPSLYEGLGTALIEAQAAGLDCFISDSIPQEADCGKCMRLSVDAGSAEWAERICRYIQSGETMSIDRQRIEQFDIRNAAGMIMRFYAGER